MPKLPIWGLICLGAAITAPPAGAQYNALDLHLEHQLWTRLQDHQNELRSGGAKSSEPERAVVAPDDVGLDALATLIDLPEVLAYVVHRSAELGAGLPTLPADRATRWAEAVRQTYDPEKMIPVALDVLRQHMDSTTISETIAFLQSPAGEKLRQAERAFRTRHLMPYDLLAEREKALAEAYPHRHGLYFDLGGAIHSDPDFSDMEMLLRALLAPSLGEAVTDGYVASASEAFRAALPESRTIYAIELLPNLPESDLAAILEFFRTPAGQAFARAKSGLSAAVIEAEIDMLTARMAD